MSAFLIALTVAVPAALGPWIAIRANGRERRKDQKATWARDDQVAAQAAEAARLLLAAQRESIARTDQVAAHVAAATTTTQAKLDALDAQGRAIHTLVNQKLTDATEKALLATAALLEVLEETAAKQAELGQPPSAVQSGRMDRARREVAALTETLADRAAQQRVVDGDLGLGGRG